MTTHRLTTLLDKAHRGVFPEANGRVEIIGPPPGKTEAVVSFTGHTVVATSVDPREVRAHLRRRDLGAAMDAMFLCWLSARLGVLPGAVDAVLLGPRIIPQSRIRLNLRDDLISHPRIARARRYRTDVRAYGDPEGGSIVAVGRGLAGRWEIAVEILESKRNAGFGREVIAAALRQVPRGEPLFAQVSPGNARSLRAFLAVRFRPIASEVLFVVR
jgi:hypothetical protein